MFLTGLLSACPMLIWLKKLSGLKILSTQGMPKKKEEKRKKKEAQGVLQ